MRKRCKSEKLMAGEPVLEQSALTTDAPRTQSPGHSSKAGRAAKTDSADLCHRGVSRGNYYSV